jgi:hypothetical protein
MGGDHMLAMGGKEFGIADQAQRPVSDTAAKMIEGGNGDLWADARRFAHGDEYWCRFLDVDLR